MVELTGSRLLLNMRNYDPARNTRQQVISADGGLTWTQQRLVPELIEPICQASIRRLSWPDTNRRSVLLFSNPASLKRERLTLRASFDEGETWPVARLVDARASAYSCLTILPNSLRAGVFDVSDRGVLVGTEFAYNLGLQVGDGMPTSRLSALR